MLALQCMKVNFVNSHFVKEIGGVRVKKLCLLVFKGVGGKKSLLFPLLLLINQPALCGLVLVCFDRTAPLYACGLYG